MYRLFFLCAITALLAGCGGGGNVEEGEVVDQVMATPSVYSAAKAGDLEGVKSFIEFGRWDPQQPDDKGVTALNYAAESGNVEIIRLMVKNGANVNQIDVKGNTPLMIAEKNGHTEAVQVLKELGATH